MLSRPAPAGIPCCCRQPLALLTLLALTAAVAPQRSPLALECPEADSECLRRCRPGTVGEPRSRMVGSACRRPISGMWMDSQLRCWIDQVPESPRDPAVTEVTNASALLSWTPSAKWPNVTRVHYECRLASEAYLASYFDQRLLAPVLGSVRSVRRRPDGTEASNTAVRVEGLRPGQTYNCFLWAEISRVKGGRIVAKLRTVPSAPAFPVGNLQLSYGLQTDSISVKWQNSRPKSDPVTGYKVTVGKSERILDRSADHFEVSLSWWSQLIDTTGNLVNVTIAPINANGTGPETKASVMPPPYDDYHLSINGCDTEDRVYTFENPTGDRHSPNVCYREVFYQACTRKDP